MGSVAEHIDGAVSAAGECQGKGLVRIDGCQYFEYKFLEIGAVVMRGQSPIVESAVVWKCD